MARAAGEDCSALEHPAAVRLATGSALDGARPVARPERHHDVTAYLAGCILEGKQRSDHTAQPAVGAPPDEIGAVGHLRQADVKGVERCGLVQVVEREAGSCAGERKLAKLRT